MTEITRKQRKLQKHVNINTEPSQKQKQLQIVLVVMFSSTDVSAIDKASPGHYSNGFSASSSPQCLSLTADGSKERAWRVIAKGK